VFFGKAKTKVKQNKVHDIFHPKIGFECNENMNV
jgi:hypothetical protein